MAELVARLEHLENEIKQLYKARLSPTHDCFTLEEVAEEIGRTVDTIREHIKQRKLHVRFPRAKRCIHPDDLEAYLRNIKPRKSKIL